MPHRMTLAKSRLVIARLSVSIFRVMVGTYLQSENFGSKAGDIILCDAVLVGQLERRAMTAAKLASYCGIPRATAIRRLAYLEERGLVIRNARGRYLLPLNLIEAPEISSAVRTIEKLIHDAACALSKLDTLADCVGGSVAVIQGEEIGNGQ